jgi:hypothetical protein
LAVERSIGVWPTKPRTAPSDMAKTGDGCEGETVLAEAGMTKTGSKLREGEGRDEQPASLCAR